MPDVFPLPLVPFEQYMLDDDRPGYPMTIVLELEFQGVLRRREFEEAIEVARSRHPILRSHVRRPWFGQRCWVDAGDARPFFHWGSLGEPLVCPHGERINLTREIGVRFWVRVGEDTTKLVVQFHHACVDATGAMVFLSDLFADYAHRLGDTRPEFMPVDDTKLPTRGDLKIKCSEPISRWRFYGEAVWHAMKLLFRPATPLAVSPGTPRESGTLLPFPAIHTRTLPPSVFRGLRQIARDFQVTVNDLLVRELYQAMRNWNLRHNPRRKPKWLVITMPCNLRTYEHIEMPAANVMSYGFLSCHARECDAPDELLENIHRESLLIQRRSYPAMFAGILRVGSWFPRNIWAYSRVPRSISSSVLSYVGNPTRVITAQFPINESGYAVLGNLTLTGINAAPPVRPWTRASFSVWHFNNELRVSVHWDRSTFTPEHAQQLLDDYVARIAACTAIPLVSPVDVPAAA
jgi:hypothetical protein